MRSAQFSSILNWLARRMLGSEENLTVEFAGAFVDGDQLRTRPLRTLSPYAARRAAVTSEPSRAELMICTAGHRLQGGELKVQFSPPGPRLARREQYTQKV